MQDQASWTDRFAGLEALEADRRRYLETRSRIVHVPKDSVVFSPGMAPESMLLLLAGTVRVQQVSEGGREIVLYRVVAGESCVLTTTCLLAHEGYAAEGVTETDVEAVAIPRATFEELLARSAAFRDFVFSGYSARIAELFLVINEIAFSRVDIRLARKLRALAGPGARLRVTQQELATELGTAREVISRQLKEFKRKGWIETARGEIALVDRDAIGRLAETA